MNRREFLQCLAGATGLAAAKLYVPERLLALPEQFDQIPRDHAAVAIVSTEDQVIAARTIPVRWHNAGNAHLAFADNITWTSDQIALPGSTIRRVEYRFPDIEQTFERYVHLTNVPLEAFGSLTLAFDGAIAEIH